MESRSQNLLQDAVWMMVDEGRDDAGVLVRSLHSTLSQPGRKNTETHQALLRLTSGQGDILLHRTKDEEIDLPLQSNWHYLPGHRDESHRINGHFLMDGV